MNRGTERDIPMDVLPEYEPTHQLGPEHALDYLVLDNWNSRPGLGASVRGHCACSAHVCDAHCPCTLCMGHAHSGKDEC
jgi:hypothetical protein